MAKKKSPQSRYAETTEALKTALERWEDPVMMAVLLPFYRVREFNNVGKKETRGVVIHGLLRTMGIIQVREDRRYEASKFGKLYMRHLQQTNQLTRTHGAEFILKYGTVFGRRIQFDAVWGEGI